MTDTGLAAPTRREASATPAAGAHERAPDWVLMFSGSPWRVSAHRQHALARQLATDRRVVFVDPPGNTPRWRWSVRQVDHSLWHALPPVILPFGRQLPAVNRLNRRLTALRLARWLAGWPGTRIVWLDEDLAWPVCRRLDATAVIYDATDLDWTFTRRWNRGHLRRALRCAVSAADLVLASSSALPARLPDARRSPVLLANGCDPELFTPDGPVAPALAGLPRPILGYLGTIDTRALDGELVAALAAARPEWTVLLVGPSTRAGLAPLRGLPNVRLWPAVPFAEAPDLVRGFDVGIIPYRIGGLIDYVHPKKCYEFLATGRPVVATRLPALRELSAPVRLAATAARFVAAVEEELATAWCPRAIAERRAAAVPHSWDSRGALLRDLVTEVAYQR
ncbi:glycosyltransferase [Micromonospora sp. WMMD1102]|uniref:glycosyltransferase n=1 Tax=Micromonospora sp. WMMD1102 TaxID=3016105 RepID=UPI0024158BCB|nr:glycosyltransferase [Micromonospora sp. WMMD1102]MDG4786344.1 glycosyltransferase [Micromonospora sp. WMMD1102]